MQQPKVLILDIETAPMVVHVWGRKDVNISLNQIQRDWSIIAWAAKWLGEPASKTIYKDARHSKSVENDRALILPLWKLLDEADIVITQNGQSFDGPKLNARFILHGMKPPSPYKHLDTYRIVRRVAAFTSNKLEYLTDKLCTKYKKLKHKKFPGQELWTQCLKGNKAAWNEMQRYNVHDVLSTEELYNKIRAWVPNTLPQVFLGEFICGACGGRIQPRGYNYTRVSKFHKFVCVDCGKWTVGKREPLA